MFGLALRAIATALGWSGGKGKGIRRLETVALCVAAGFWLLSIPVILPVGTDLLIDRGMKEGDAFSLMAAIVTPCNALLGVIFGWIIGPDPGPKPPSALANPYADDNSLPPSEEPPTVTAPELPIAPPGGIALSLDEPAAPLLVPAEDPPDDTSPSAFSGMASGLAAARGQSEELWSSHGRDALFLAVVSCLLLASACIVPILGFILAGMVGLITMVMAVRALVVAGNRSSKGVAFAVVALVMSLIPVGLATLYMFGMIVSALAR
jgi:hypothetical protein